MPTTNEAVLSLWGKVTAEINNIHKDVLKNATKNTVLAGIRARRGLRLIRKMCMMILRETIEQDKETRKERVAQKKRGST